MLKFARANIVNRLTCLKMSDVRCVQVVALKAAGLSAEVEAQKVKV